MWQESQAVHVADVYFNDGDAVFFGPRGSLKKERGLNRQPIEVHWAIDGAAMAKCKATWCKMEEGTSIMWEGFVAFLCIHRVTADGCTRGHYFTFSMCEGVLPWLLVKETHFKVPSQHSWEIVAQHPFKVVVLSAR